MFGSFLSCTLIMLHCIPSSTLDGLDGKLNYSGNEPFNSSLNRNVLVRQNVISSTEERRFKSIFENESIVTNKETPSHCYISFPSNECFKQKTFYSPKTKLREGNFFIGVCPQQRCIPACNWAGVVYPNMHLDLGCVDREVWTGGVHSPPLPCDGYCSGWYASY